MKGDSIRAAEKLRLEALELEQVILQNIETIIRNPQAPNKEKWFVIWDLLHKPEYAANLFYALQGLEPIGNTPKGLVGKLCAIANVTAVETVPIGTKVLQFRRGTMVPKAG